MWVSASTSELYTEAATDPNGRRKGLLSGWGSSADTPSSPSPAHTAERHGPWPASVPLHMPFPAWPTPQTPAPSPVSSSHQPRLPTTSLGAVAHSPSACSPGGAPRQPCPALLPRLLVYVPPRFPLGPSGSLSWVLALSSTEPADVFQMNRRHSAKLCVRGQAGGVGDRPSPVLKQLRAVLEVPPPDSPRPHSDTPAWPP